MKETSNSRNNIHAITSEYDIIVDSLNLRTSTYRICLDDVQKQGMNS